MRAPSGQNGRGLMEVPRQLLAIAGRFPGETGRGGYTDLRIVDDEPGGQHPTIGGKTARKLGDVADSLDILALKTPTMDDYIEKKMKAAS